MIEATTNPAARDAIKSAHDARGQATRDFWNWMFGRG